MQSAIIGQLQEKVNAKVAERLAMVFTSMLSQYPTQLAALAPQWLRICAEKELR